MKITSQTKHMIIKVNCYESEQKNCKLHFLDILCIESLTNFVWFHDLLPLNLSGSLLYVVTNKIEPHNMNSENATTHQVSIICYISYISYKPLYIAQNHGKHH